MVHPSRISPVETRPSRKTRPPPLKRSQHLSGPCSLLVTPQNPFREPIGPPKAAVSVNASGVGLTMENGSYPGEFVQSFHPIFRKFMLSGLRKGGKGAREMPGLDYPQKRGYYRRRGGDLVIRNIVIPLVQLFRIFPQPASRPARSRAAMNPQRGRTGVYRPWSMSRTPG